MKDRKAWVTICKIHHTFCYNLTDEYKHIWRYHKKELLGGNT